MGGGEEACFSAQRAVFFLFEKDDPERVTVLVLSLYGCLHTSRIRTNGVNTLKRVSFSERGF